jgi:hypothetical protein
MGLWLLFLSTSNPVDVLPFDLPDPGQLQAAHSNLMRMSAALLLDYHRHCPALEDEHERGLGLLLDGDEEDVEAAAASGGGGEGQGAKAAEADEAQVQAAEAAETEAAARRKLLGLIEEKGAEEAPAAFKEKEKGPEGASEPAVWRSFVVGSSGRSRGASGLAVSGNNMAHVVELLREQALPLPPAGGLPQVDPAEEAAYMREVVLPADPLNPSVTREPAALYEKDRATRKWVKVDFGEGEGEGEEVDERTMMMRHQQAQLQAALRVEAEAEAAAAAATSSSSASAGGGSESNDKQGEEEGQGAMPPSPSSPPPQMNDRSAFIRIDEGFDEDVGKLQKMMKNSFPAFSAWPQIFGGVATEPAEGEVGGKQEEGEGGEQVQEQQEEQGATDAGEEDEEPLMLGGAGFTAPQFTPYFPPTSPSERRAAPPTKRQSWGSRGGKGGDGGGGEGGGRRRKK